VHVLNPLRHDGAMITTCLTGATDGIGLATAKVLLAAGHRVLVHARSEERGRPVVDALAADPSSTGEALLVTGDLSRLAEVRSLAEQVRSLGPVDVLVHNAGVWVRGETPASTPDGFETTFGVNVLAPHLLTTLLADQITDRLIWLGSGMAGSGRPDPAHLGTAQGPSRAYADSKACDVALAVAWGRRRPGLASAALDPGWVQTKLASSGAPGVVEDSAASLAFCCTPADAGGADLGSAPYWRGRRSIALPGRLRDPDFCEAVAAGCDELLEALQQ
jgi:NAD(P)-dependent dehydrogenase (short-subunit alcohol dehydrogenase family)